MLKQRILTALVLVSVLFFALLSASPLPFALVSIVLMSAAAWEWARLNQLQGAMPLAFGGVCASLCIWFWQSDLVAAALPRYWLLMGAFWVVLGSVLLGIGVEGWKAQPRWFRCVGGLLLLLAAWLAVMQARRVGLNFLFSAMSLVWVADIAAYFSGRAFGGKWFRRKLAPAISPGKTWEGVVGGVFGVLLTGLIWLGCESGGGADSPSIYRVLLNFGPVVAFLGCLFLAAMSVVGDLLESLVKRAAGFKDSSQLLPGHGGVLDRIDALLPTLPLAMMFATLGGA